MTTADTDAVHSLGMRTLFTAPPGDDPAATRRWITGRLEHLLVTDPGGAWVLDGDGEVRGVSMALVREHVWGLSLFAVDEDLRGRGSGRALLKASLAYGEEREAEGWLVVSSESPAAMRLYSHHAGMDVRPAVACLGIPDLGKAPDQAADVVDAGPAGVALAEAIGREVRGAGHGSDLDAALSLGCRLLVYEDRAFALARDGVVSLLAGRDDEAAAIALWGVFLTAPRGSTAIVTSLTGSQQWAVRTCLQAGLPLSVDGPLMTRGRLGPLAPYVPNGLLL